jgi:hypothetical protein
MAGNYSALQKPLSRNRERRTRDTQIGPKSPPQKSLKFGHDSLMRAIFQVAGSHLRYKNVAVASGKDAEEKKALPLVRDFFLLSFTKQ